MAGIRKLVSFAGRLALSTGGPMAVAGANFLVSLSTLAMLGGEEFGSIAFMMGFAIFATSVSTGLVASPLSVEMQHEPGREVIDAFLSGGTVYAVVGAVVTGLVGLHVTGDATAAIGFAIYTHFLIHRNVDRMFYVSDDRPFRAVGVDAAYFVAMMAAVLWIRLGSQVDLATAATALAVGSTASVVLGSPDLLLRKLSALSLSVLRRYVGFWKGTIGWSTLGVVATDFSLNAHAYAVTLVLGPEAYAPVAVAALAWRPFVIVLFSVASFERSKMARSCKAGDTEGVRRSVRSLHGVNAVVYGGTAVVGLLSVVYGLELLGKSEYPVAVVLPLFGLLAASMLIRSIREPFTQSLNAARAYRTTAICATVSAIVGVASSAGLAATFGVQASLLGLVAADLVFLAGIFVAYRRIHGRRQTVTVQVAMA